MDMLHDPRVFRPAVFGPFLPLGPWRDERGLKSATAPISSISWCFPDVSWFPTRSEVFFTVTFSDSARDWWCLF